MEDVDYFVRKTRDFLAWFKSLPGSTFHNDIQICDLRQTNAGRGIVATADIEADTVLFTIPRKGIICAHTSELVAKIPSIFDDNEIFSGGESDEDEEITSRQQDSWTLLIIIMIYEYLHGESSAWKPYLDVLPSHFETLMFWSDDELKELQASSVISKIGKADAEMMIRSKILPVVLENENVFYEGGARRLPEEELVKLAHRMGSIIMAYAFDLENDEAAEDAEEDGWVEDREGKVMMGMVPMADILNADAEFNAHINHEDDALTATALRPIKAGEEILNYYGPLPNSELLRRYGYTTKAHSRYDVAELPWDLLLAALQARLSLGEDEVTNIINSFDAEDLEDGFVLDRSLDEADSTGRVSDDNAFKDLPAELEDQVKAFLQKIRKVKPETIPDKRKRDEIYLITVQDAIAARIRQYHTSLEQDQLLLDTSTGRSRMALGVRMGEKMLLSDASEFVKARIDSVSGEEDDSQPARKRRKG